jgi:hypothetical protein
MKYDMILERVITLYEFFVIFPGIMKKVFRLQIKGITVQILH